MQLGVLMIAGLLQASPAAAGDPPQWPTLLQKRVLRSYRAGFDGEVHLYVKDLSTGVRYTHNAATRTYIASGVKLLFMVEAFRQIEAGTLSLDEELEYGENDVRDGAPLLNYIPLGAKLPFRILLESMVTQSDNVASDMVAARVGIENINKGLKMLGYTGVGRITSLIDVRRLIYQQLDPRVDDLTERQLRSLGFARGAESRARRLAELVDRPAGTFAVADIDQAFRAYYAAGYNSASMEAIGELLEDLVTGAVVSSTASKAMVDLMLGTQTGARRITAKLPPDIRVAHKTGTQYRRTCDLGVIFMPDDRKIVFAACLKEGRGSQREALIASFARKTYDLLLSPDGAADVEPRRRSKRRSRRRGRVSAQRSKKKRKP